jgi:D-arabinose 1-dehydrogenase-like Zn-dependent alcohol dehydrogenase
VDELVSTWSHFVTFSLLIDEIVKGCVAFSRDSTAELARFVEEHNIKPAIAKEFDFENTVEAFEALQNLNAVGKVVIKISDE